MERTSSPAYAKLIPPHVQTMEIETQFGKILDEAYQEFRATIAGVECREKQPWLPKFSRN